MVHAEKPIGAPECGAMRRLDFGTKTTEGEDKSESVCFLELFSELFLFLPLMQIIIICVIFTSIFSST